MNKMVGEWNGVNMALDELVPTEDGQPESEHWKGRPKYCRCYKSTFKTKNARNTQAATVEREN